MHADVKQQLLEALRSDLYRQIPYQLRHGETDYCALGVLDELYHQAGQGPRHSGEFLPEPVLTWAGLSETAAARIAALNNSGMSFRALADLLERISNDDDLPPPYAPAVIPVAPKRRVLSGAVTRRLVAA